MVARREHRQLLIAKPPGVHVLRKLRINAFTTRAPGSLFCSSSAPLDAVFSAHEAIPQDLRDLTWIGA